MVNCCNQTLIRGGGAKALADISNQIGQADVTRWGIVATVFGGIALLSISLAGNVPENLAVGLHATRIEGSTINMLREQVSELESQQRQLTRGNTTLDSQFRLSERDQGELLRRLNALETAIPALLEVVPPDAELDFSLLTGAIGDETAESFDADGGSVTVINTPMFPEPADVGSQSVLDAIPALPPMLGTDVPEELRTVAPDPDVTLTATEYGLAIGEIITDETAEPVWAALRQKIGTLLLGLEPALSDPAGTGDARIIVGPISDYAAAESLCLRITRAGVPCLPVQYADDALLELSALNATN